MFNNVNESNFLLFAANHYTNPECFDDVEFADDIKKIKYIKRLFNGYQGGKPLRERLILNHVIVLYNVFESDALTKMLFLKLKGYETYLVPFLIHLSFMPDIIDGVGDELIHCDNIIPDKQIMEALERL